MLSVTWFWSLWALGDGSLGSPVCRAVPIPQLPCGGTSHDTCCPCVHPLPAFLRRPVAVC